MKRLIAIVLLPLMLLSLVCCKGREPGAAAAATPELTTPAPYAPGMTYEEAYNPDTDFNNF